MTMTMIKPLRALGAAAALTLAACSGSGTSPVSVTQQNLGADVLQLAVGTANIYGSPSGPNGLNVVVTYRQPSGALAPGDSAVAVSTPTFSGPAALPGTAGSTGALFSTIETGPAPSELGTHSMTGTSQSGSTPTTFGRSGGAFGLGIEPFNYNGNGSVDSIAPYKIPLYDPGNCSSSSCSSGSGDANALVPSGRPSGVPQSAQCVERGTTRHQRRAGRLCEHGSKIPGSYAAQRLDSGEHGRLHAGRERESSKAVVLAAES